MMRAVEKIAQSGLPTRAVQDRYIRAIMDDGAFEDDEAMQERWENLLANAGTVSDALVQPAFPAMLRELAPTDAALLEALHDLAVESVPHDRLPAESLAIGLGLTTESYELGIDNLIRLRLCRPWIRTLLGSSPEDPSTVVLTSLGYAFVRACRPPRGPE
jgi:hypothetical protein